jgi:thiamine biosynthesis lipoprotein
MKLQRLGFALLLGLLAVLTTHCGPKDKFIEGRTMGTTYHITVRAGFFQAVEPLKKAIDERLAEINGSMSTYESDSEISRFNAIADVNETFRPSEDFFRVMETAQHLYRITGGAWDGTVHPLVNLWGFGASRHEDRIPAPEEITKLLGSVGFERIEITEDGLLRKKHPEVTLDLASIAKGYAVDEVADMLRRRGFAHFIVEIGGEVYAAGLRQDGSSWKVGINHPQKNAPPEQLHKTVRLSGAALATSGDYRNYFEADGKTYSHIIDPRTGYPVDNGTVSASVLADRCVFADGLATALVVMGPERGLRLVNQLADVEALIVVRDQQGRLVDHYSDGLDSSRVSGRP